MAGFNFTEAWEQIKNAERGTRADTIRSLPFTYKQAILAKRSGTGPVARVVQAMSELASSTVGAAIASGKLTRPDHCEDCGAPCRPEGHHDDYDKPLSVRWLCWRCHSDADRARAAWEAQARRALWPNGRPTSSREQVGIRFPWDTDERLAVAAFHKKQLGGESPVNVFGAAAVAESVERLHHEGYSLTDIAAMFGVSRGCVYDWCERYDIEKRSRGNYAMCRLWDDDAGKFEPCNIASYINAYEPRVPTESSNT